MCGAKRRLLVLTSTFPRWPDDHDPPFVYELSRRLTTHWEVHILAPHAPGLPVQENFGGLNVHRFRYAPEAFESLAYQGGMLARLKQKPLRYLLIPFFLVSQYLYARRLIVRYDIDVVHAHWLIPQGLVAAILKITRSKPLPVLCTSHGSDLFSLRGPLLAKTKQWIIRRCDHLTVVSRAMKEQVQRLGAAPSQIDVAPMGVDLSSRFAPEESSRNAFTLVFVGRLVEKKGLVHLLDAFPRVLVKHEKTRLIIAGDGPKKEQLMAHADTLGISHHIDFMGPIPNQELPAVFHLGHIAVFPFVVASNGDQEGLGLVMIEALGCGCSVVASDLPAIRDIIIDGTTGRTVQPADPGDLANTINNLLENPTLCRSLAREGRQQALQRFDWSIVAKQYNRLLHSLIRE